MNETEHPSSLTRQFRSTPLIRMAAERDHCRDPESNRSPAKPFVETIRIKQRRLIVVSQIVDLQF